MYMCAVYKHVQSASSYTHSHSHSSHEHTYAHTYITNALTPYTCTHSHTHRYMVSGEEAAWKQKKEGDEDLTRDDSGNVV
jgi:hypothetical protein